MSIVHTVSRFKRRLKVFRISTLYELVHQQGSLKPRTIGKQLGVSLTLVVCEYLLVLVTDCSGHLATCKDQEQKDS